MAFPVLEHKADQAMRSAGGLVNVSGSHESVVQCAVDGLDEKLFAIFGQEILCGWFDERGSFDFNQTSLGVFDHIESNRKLEAWS